MKPCGLLELTFGQTQSYALSQEEFNPLLRQEVRRQVELYKQVIRPILKDCWAYHHTPLTPMMEASPWLVLESSAPDSLAALGWVFRTAESGDSTYWFRPRGLNFSKKYNVTFSSRGRTLSSNGDRLRQEGIPVQLESDLTSERLILRAQ